MRVIHICTAAYDSTAAVRQHAALIKNGIESYVITLNNYTSFYNKNIIVVKPNKLEKIINKFQDMREHARREKICNEYRRMPYNFSLKNVNIKKYLNKDDIVHIHWAVGVLSLRQYKRITKSYKTVISLDFTRTSRPSNYRDYDGYFPKKPEKWRVYR